MGANLILPAGSAAAADSTPADPVTRSLRFDGSTSKLTRTPSSASSATACTISFWVKRGKTDEENTVFHAGTASGDRGHVRFNSNNTLEVACYNGSWFVELKTNAVYRDPSAFYHIFVSIDTTNGTGKLFVNGEEPSLQTNTTNSSSTVLPFGKTIEHQIGQRGFDSTGYHDGLLADFYFIDGTALSTPVGNLIEDTGYSSYKPKAFDMSSYSGNSFHIDAQPAHDADLLVTSIDRNDGDTDFADVAAGHDLTVSGDTEHSIAVGNPFTGDDRAIYFDGSGDYLTVSNHSDLTPSTGDFTVEAWINYSSIPDSSYGSVIYGVCGGAGGPSGDSLAFMLKPNGHLGLIYGDAHYTGSSSTAMSSGTWYHVALVRSSGTVKLYIDGDEDYSATHSGNLNNTTDNRIGARGGTPMYFDGYMYDLRFSSTAKYTSSFTPPTSKLTDESDTELLIQPDKDDTGFHDETSTGHTISATGSPTRTASTPYDAAAKSTAIYIPASSNYSDSNYLETSVSTDFSVGTGAYTLEGWIYIPTDYTGNFTPFGHYGADITMHGKTIGCYANSASQNSSTSVDIGEWKHVAVVRESTSSNGGAIYYDGNRIHQFTHSADLSAAVEVALSGQNGQYWNQTAYYYDVRLTKGTARYTGSTYTVPSAPFELNPIYIGGDQSGNKNHFTPTNISGHDVMLDVPYPKNYATLNQVSDVVSSGSNTFSNGSLTLNPSNAYNKAASTIAVSSGKWYAEVRYDSAGNQMAGIGRVDCLENTTNYIGQSSSAFGYVIYRPTGDMYHNGSTTDIFSGLSSGDILQIALDLDSNTVWWGLNGTWVGTVGSSGGTSITAGEYYFVQTYRNPCTWNFGQDNTFAGQFTGTPNNAEFAYEIPENFKSLNSSNLDDPVVTPSEHFDILTYNGNSDLYNGSGSTQNVTGVNFDVGMAWIKDRDNNSSGYTYSGYDEYGHYLFDTVTGTSTGGYNLDGDVVSSGSGAYLNSGYYGVTSFSAGSGTSRGITVDEAGETNFDYDDGYYQLTERYVAWLWKLGSTGSSSTWNSSYTAPSTEHYNASAGVTAIEVSPASSGNLEVAHSLSAAPEFFFVGHDSYPNFTGYPAFHKDLDSGKYLQLDGNSAQSSDSTYFPSGAAHADYIKLGSVFSDEYGYGGNLRIWAFTGVEGYSRFGTYRGAGSNGVFVYTGHRPKVIWIKNMDTTGNWFIFDAARDTYNETVNYLHANSSTSETTNSGYKIDVLSNGFKINVESTHMNNSAYDYVFCSFAEQPFKHANAR